MESVAQEAGKNRQDVAHEIASRQHGGVDDIDGHCIGG
jgi:hypothetical protein